MLREFFLIQTVNGELFLLMGILDGTGSGTSEAVPSGMPATRVSLLELCTVNFQT